MDNVNDFLQRIREREADPAWQAQQRQQREQRERENGRAIASAQRNALAKLDLPPKDVELLRNDAVKRTPALEVLDSPPVLTVLSGGAGCGKTVAACWWLYSWLMDQKNWAIGQEFKAPKLMGSAVFVTAARLARWDRYDDGAMRLLLHASRLVIDDLGVEFLDQKGSFLALFDEVVNERYSARRPTVLTTNLPVSEFRVRYGERVASRIREVGEFVALGDRSLRLPGGVRVDAGAAATAVVPPPAGVADRRLPRERDDDEDGRPPS